MAYCLFVKKVSFKEKNMKILAIDTASSVCSAAILENDEIIDETNLDNGKTHSENLMPIVAEILEKNNLKLSDLDLLSCCVGPGSFTGIRIGVASVKAMAEVNHLPVAGVSSLETLARMDACNRMKVSLIDARNHQVYCGIFDEEYQQVQEYLADDVTNVMEILKKYENLVFIGDGAVLHKEEILQQFPSADFLEKNKQSAGFGGKVAYQKYLKKETQTADTILPLYLRKSQAERMKDGKN